MKMLFEVLFSKASKSIKGIIKVSRFTYGLILV